MDGPSRRPTEQCRSEGMPSLSEAPSGGAKPFAYFLAFEKVSRCKSETIGGRYRSNGYVPLDRVIVLRRQTWLLQGLWLFSDPRLRQFHRKIRENQISPGPLDGAQAFAHHAIFIDSPGLCGELDHRVLPAHLIRRQGQARGFANVADDVEVRSGRLDHQRIGAFLFVQQRLPHRLTTIHRVHLVAFAIALERAAASFAERS